ncbi:uncharacterized protein LOC101856278 isoform X2 [Aplysia californica]|uniref:Uncharacterized protein LOC101856278 isoform X2 n=1 Tax=Aplysia californica TaxID=6500 RepID=A0ABM0JX87_APLCA|nr:uncharacterized protein LOC101856278 isoform X2 [Aplysia californica]
MLKTTDQTFLHITEKNEARMFSGFTKYVSLAILAIFSVVGPALASPVSQPTIDNPCRITSSAPPEYLSLQQEITLTLNVLETLRSSCEDGVTTMTYENLLTNDEIAPLLSNPMYNLQGLPFLPANRSISEENMARILLKDYHDVSVFTVFAQQVYDEEDGNEVLKADLLKVKHYFYSALCKLDTILGSINNPVSDFVSSDVMPDTLKNITSDKYRYMRAFLLLNSAMKHIEVLHKDYENLQENVSTA